MAMAQTLESARYDAILRSAIGTGLVDHVLPVEEMPAKLIEYAAHLASLNGRPQSARPDRPRARQDPSPAQAPRPGMISASTRRAQSRAGWNAA